MTDNNIENYDNENIITDSQLELCKTAVHAMVEYFEGEFKSDWQWDNSREFFGEQVETWKKLENELNEL